MAQQTYPDCTAPSLCGGAAPRTVSYTRLRGLLTAVPGFATAITYHPNGLYHQITHANGVVDIQTNDPFGVARPRELSAQHRGAYLWRSGTYLYDGAGNVTQTGAGYYLYDRVSRLRDGHVMDGPTNRGLQRFQTYGFDPFGNLNSIGGDPWAPGRSTPTSPASNHLTGGTYDDAGNLTTWQGNTYTYDAFGMMTGSVTSGEDRRFIYTAGDERLWSFLLGGSFSTWALRDLDGRVLREYEPHVNWATAKDYIYRDGQLIATSHPAEGVRHLHLDHLGTPRLVSGSAGAADGFYTVTPCRVLDTRTTSTPIQAGETRIVQMTGACGIPPNAAAVSVNLTVEGATATGELTAMPATAVAVPESTAISYAAGTTRANNAVLMLGNGALGFFSRQPAGNVHLLVDVNGYFVAGEGSAVAYHAYFPFGEELTSPFQDTEQMKLTGHERDLNNLGSVADDLDYMHARFCSPLTGRFLSVDHVQGDPKKPQTWNRYTYARGNPLRLIDPDGLAERDAMSVLVVRVNVVYSRPDVKINKGQTLRQVTEAGIARARDFFSKAGIALDVKRFEGSVSLGAGRLDGPVQTAAGQKSLGEMVASGGLTVVASGDLPVTGKTLGIGGPTAIGVLSNTATLTDELAHALGNVIGSPNSLTNTYTDQRTNLNEASVALGLGMLGGYEEMLRETAARIGCVAGQANCPPEPK